MHVRECLAGIDLVGRFLIAGGESNQKRVDLLFEGTCKIYYVYVRYNKYDNIVPYSSFSFFILDTSLLLFFELGSYLGDVARKFSEDKGTEATTTFVGRFIFKVSRHLDTESKL